jgi:hypothetical protein
MEVLEVGRTYLTRGGGTVEITDQDYAYSRPFFGRIMKDGKLDRPASFYGHGAYSEKPTDWDIIRRKASS